LSTQDISKRPSFRKEAIILAILLPFGIVFMPSAAYVVGGVVFGDYAGDGFAGFFSTIGAKLLAGHWVAWLLVASPYLIVQCLRLTAFGWRFVRMASHST
jgi:hypothetical protein